MMKDKLIDTSLLVVLILVALAIFGTLLSSFGLSIPNPFPSRAPIVDTRSNDVVTPQPAAVTDAPIVVITPESSGNVEVQGATPTAVIEAVEATEANPAVAVTPLDPNTQIIAPPAAEIVEAVTQDIAEVVVEEAPIVITPVAEGSLTLERVGFSAITGGVGACNVILESWKHLTVSRDIKATHPCGTTLTVVFDDPVAGRTSFTGVVGDTMGPSTTKTVNVYVETKELALTYGINGGTLQP